MHRSGSSGIFGRNHGKGRPFGRARGRPKQLSRRAQTNPFAKIESGARFLPTSQEYCPSALRAEKSTRISQREYCQTRVAAPAKSRVQNPFWPALVPLEASGPRHPLHELARRLGVLWLVLWSSHASGLLLSGSGMIL